MENNLWVFTVICCGCGAEQTSITTNGPDDKFCCVKCKNDLCFVVTVHKKHSEIRPIDRFRYTTRTNG